MTESKLDAALLRLGAKLARAINTYKAPRDAGPRWLLHGYASILADARKRIGKHSRRASRAYGDRVATIVRPAKELTV